MFFKLILAFCNIQNATPISYKHHKDVILFGHFNRRGVNLNHNHINENPLNPLFKENSSDSSNESRRLFDWIKKVLNKNDTKGTTQKTRTYEELMNEKIRFRQMEKNLTETLTKLSHVLNQILNIVKYSRYTHFDDIHEFLPTKLRNSQVNRRYNRFKRNVDKVNVVFMKTGKENTSNKTITANETDIAKNGRRAMSPIQVTNNEVKNRLFQYIDEAFAEIIKKIDSLKSTKQMFSKDVSYQVGYIISNIDTLEVNMLKMKRDMDKNKYIWDDKKILNLYDTVKLSNQAIADLLDILKNYIEKSLN
ncbi:uncharacterized protein [Maniola hyperantus]|uniref:uncharacterized protein isoform X2 n=1 Tax=Aphantopus hyperantus TaxID=2795564 RepID=UPI00374A3C97